MTKFRSAARPAGLFCLWTIAGLLALELVLRTFYISPSRRTVDPIVGPEYEAFADILYASEGYARSHTNSLGLLDDEISRRKPPLRVLLLGDSFVEAKQVPHERRMDVVAERALGPGVEVINAGHSGWGPPDSVPFLQKYFDDLQPDVLVLALSDDDVRQLATPGRSRLVREGEGWKLETRRYSRPNSALRRIARTLARSSSLVTFLRRRVSTLAGIERSRLQGKFAAPSDQTIPPEDFDRLKAEPGMLDALFEPYLSRNVPVVVIYLPKGRYFHPQAKRLPTAFASQLAEFCRRNDLSLIDPTRELWDSFDRTHRPGHGFQNSIYGTGHLNAHGHAILGQELASTLRTIVP